MAETKKRRKRTKSVEGRATESKAARYTPPIPISVKHSSRIVPILMFLFFGLGVAVIILGYIPGSPIVSKLAELAGFESGANYVYVVTGLVLISLGFVVATRYK